jgi:hypothetical protein
MYHYLTYKVTRTAFNVSNTERQQKETKMGTELIIAGYTVKELAELWQEGYAEYMTDSLAYHNGESELLHIENETITESDIADVVEAQTWNWMRTEFGAFGFDAEIEEKVAESAKVLPTENNTQE